MLVDGKKLSGILVESGPAQGGVWLAVGIGVNLVVAPTEVERPAAALAPYLRPDRTAPPSPSQALDLLAAAFAHWSRLWETQGLAPILHAWSGRSRGIPGPCTVRLTGESIYGMAEGLDSEGRLRLRLGDGSVRRIAAGDVFFGGG